MLVVHEENLNGTFKIKIAFCEPLIAFTECFTFESDVDLLIYVHRSVTSIQDDFYAVSPQA